jgi:hypothetical protein
MIEYGMDPQQNPYFIGARVLEIFQSTTKSKIDFYELFGMVHQKYECNIKMFLLALTWLYVAGLIDDLNNGDIIYVA